MHIYVYKHVYVYRFLIATHKRKEFRDNSFLQSLVPPAVPMHWS